MDKYELLSKDTWSSLHKRTKTHKNIRAAIAYVTRDNLNLKEGDLLICDASDKAIRGGLTDAKILAKYHKRKVTLHSLQGLHAKVAVIDGSTFLGSANMSATAGTRTIEASIFTDNFEVAALTRAFVDGVIAHPKAVAIDDAFIEHIVKIEVKRPYPTIEVPESSARKGPTGPGKGKREKKDGSTGPSSTWFLSTTPFTPRQAITERKVLPGLVKKVEAQLRKQKGNAAAALADKIAEDADSLPYARFPKRSRIAQAVKPGHVVVICSGDKETGQYRVLTPSAVLHVEDDGQFVRICHTPILEYKDYAWSRVSAAFKKLGVTKIKPTSNIELKDDARTILDFFKQQ